MTCHRCRGLMVKDHFCDLEESYGRPWIAGWRCVTCGNILDPLIQRRRLAQGLDREPAAKEKDKLTPRAPLRSTTLPPARR